MAHHRENEKLFVPGDPVGLRIFRNETTPTEATAERFSLHDPSGDDIRALIVRSEAFLKVIEKARQVARSTVPVLIQGESGTGKELLARLIHEHSPRRKNQFVQINCAAFSETLIESEMFGHERGAFTGAEQRHAGYFERAHEGSLLLDEIGEMPLKMQPKLLRVLEESAFERVGGEQMLRVNVRVIATTNRDLAREIVHGLFRNDLYYRLNAVLLHIPPLRERPQDIGPLLQHFVERFGTENVPVTAIAPAAQELLLAYAWPGNVRQLRNVMHHACVMAHGAHIEPDDLPPLPPIAFDQPNLAPAQRTLAEIERQSILETLREVGGNRTAAALRLGVTTRTLQNKLKRYREDEAA